MDLITDIEKDKIQVFAQKQQQQEFKLIGRLTLKPGLTLWLFNYKSMTLEKAKIQRNKVFDMMSQHKRENSKTIFNPDAMYFQAHCYRTAAKKANRIIKQSIGIENYFK